MQLRTLGNSDLLVSEIGLGCWQFGGDFGPITETQVQSIITAARDNGISFFDTADVYGAGRSEAMLGACFAGDQQGAIIATKYGRGPGSYPDGYSLDDMRDAIRKAQDRLQVDVLDLLQLHCVPPGILRRGEIFDWLRSVQQDGLIRYYGASVETVEEALLCSAQKGLSSLQVIFNVFRQKLIDDLWPQVRENNIGVIVRLPLASGMLSGKFSVSTRFDESDHRHYNRDGAAFSVGETFAGIPFGTGLELVAELRHMVPAELNMAQMAMRWILDHPEVSTIIPGASSAEQVKINATVSELPPLSQDLHERLRAFYQARVRQHIRGAY